jgi:hypothetical protein
LGACIFNVYRRAGRGVGGGGVSGGGGDCRRAHQRETEKPFLSLSLLVTHLLPGHGVAVGLHVDQGFVAVLVFFVGRERKRRERGERR